MDIDHNISRPYSIVPHDQEWPKRFEEIRKILAQIWSGKALAIEHVGSTSVSGMSAKPCIDVMVVIEKPEDFTEEVEAMVKAEYKQQVIDAEEGTVLSDALWFYKAEPDGHKSENIHFRLRGSRSERSILLGRDYLRAHTERVREYNKLKSELLAQFPDNYLAYRDGKQNFMKETERLAREWRGEMSK